MKLEMKNYMENDAFSTFSKGVLKFTNGVILKYENFCEEDDNEEYTGVDRLIFEIVKGSFKNIVESLEFLKQNQIILTPYFDPNIDVEVKLHIEKLTNTGTLFDVDDLESYYQYITVHKEQ